MCCARTCSAYHTTAFKLTHSCNINIQYVHLTHRLDSVHTLHLNTSNKRRARKLVSFTIESSMMQRTYGALTFRRVMKTRRNNVIWHQLEPDLRIDV